MYLADEKIRQIVQHCWNEIPNHFSNVELDEFIVMPNHIHGIVVIKVGDGHDRPLQNVRQQQTLPKVIGSLKSAISNRLHHCISDFHWQRSYYDHVIRDDKELNNIRKYVNENPIEWNSDIENLNSSKKKLNLENYYKNIYKGEF